MSEPREDLDAVQFEELRPITLGPVATEKGGACEGLTEEDWWFHLCFDTLWFKCCS